MGKLDLFIDNFISKKLKENVGVYKGVILSWKHSVRPGSIVRNKLSWGK
jgi:hypothetical protein